MLNLSLHNKDDIQLKWQEFFQQVNKLLADFQVVRWDILVQLFSKYCNSFYGSQMWDLRSLHLQALYRSWNRAVRIVLQLLFDAHRYLLPLLLDSPSLEVQLMHRFVKICKLIKMIFSHFTYPRNYTKLFFFFYFFFFHAILHNKFYTLI